MQIPAAAVPILKAAAPTVASIAVPWLLQRIGGGGQQRRGLEDLIAQQQPYLNTLQQQAMGKETPITRFMLNRIQQAANQSKMAAAASATRQGLGAQAATARQEDINKATQQAQSDALAQAQAIAQQQYGDFMGQLLQAQEGQATREMAAEAAMASNIGRGIDEILRRYNELQNAPEAPPSDAWFEEQADFILRELKKFDLGKANWASVGQPKVVVPR